MARMRRFKINDRLLSTFRAPPVGGRTATGIMENNKTTGTSATDAEERTANQGRLRDIVADPERMKDQDHQC